MKPLKNERRTLNIERPTSNEKNGKYWMFPIRSNWPLAVRGGAER
jgi:hypothetical protein